MTGNNAAVGDGRWGRVQKEEFCFSETPYMCFRFKTSYWKQAASKKHVFITFSWSCFLFSLFRHHFLTDYHESLSQLSSLQLKMITSSRKRGGLCLSSVNGMLTIQLQLKGLPWSLPRRGTRRSPVGQGQDPQQHPHPTRAQRNPYRIIKAPSWYVLTMTLVCSIYVLVQIQSLNKQSVVKVRISAFWLIC